MCIYVLIHKHIQAWTRIYTHIHTYIRVACTYAKPTDSGDAVRNLIDSAVQKVCVCMHVCVYVCMYASDEPD